MAQLSLSLFLLPLCYITLWSTSLSQNQPKLWLAKNENVMNPFFFFYPIQGHNGRRAILGQQVRYTLDSSSDRQQFTLTDNLESPVNLTCISLDCGMKSEYPEKAQAGTKRTCQLHAEKPQLAGGFKSWSCCEMTVLIHCSTVLPKLNKN